MLTFHQLPAAPPEKRDAEVRRSDFDEIYRAFAAEAGEAQASRCSQCGVPFCSNACPLHNDIPEWLRLAAEGRMREAYEASAATNPMPEVCGRICPQDRLCEGSCVVERSGHGAVTIGAVETWITETAKANGWVRDVRPRPGAAARGSVAIIGSGPAGLAAAEALREAGAEVDIYDRADRPGGLLIYGIPNFKLDKSVVKARTDRLAAGGVRFHLEHAIDTPGAFEALRARHDAVLIATGVYRPRSLDLGPGDDPRRVRALDFLTAANRRGFGEDLSGSTLDALDAAGSRVVVIGGGDTAMDCVRTAVRQGAASVACLYRRDRSNMPGSAREVRHAEEEGVRFEWLAAPVALARQGEALTVRAERMRLGPADASGRRAPELAPGSGFTLEADLVIEALGFEPEDVAGAFGRPELVVSPRGTIKVDAKTLETRIPGVYAAGDIVRGASLVVWALRDGREAAKAIAARLAAAAPNRLSTAAE